MTYVAKCFGPDVMRLYTRDRDRDSFIFGNIWMKLNFIQPPSHSQFIQSVFIQHHLIQIAIKCGNCVKTNFINALGTIF